MNATLRRIVQHHALANDCGPVLLAIAYYIGAEVGLLIGAVSDRILAPFWPPTVVLLFALAKVPLRRWPTYICAAFPAHLLAEAGTGTALTPILVAFAANCMGAVASAYCLRALRPKRRSPDTFQAAVVYVAIAVVGCPAVCAFAGAFVRIARDGNISNYGLYWLQWFMANALGSLTLGAAMFAWSGKRDDWSGFLRPARLLEAVALVLSLVVACVAAFRPVLWEQRGLLPASLYALLPPLLWAGVRFQMRGASTANLLVTIIAVMLALQGPAIFVYAGAEDNVLALQILLLALGTPMLLLAASVSGLRYAERRAGALSSLLLQSQDKERRYVANQLHEQIGQNLVAASWMIERIRTRLAPSDQLASRQIEAKLRDTARDMRSLSYRLHPPLLDESGITVALQALAADCAKRRPLTIYLDVPENVGRMRPHIELAIFRLVEDRLVAIGDDAIVWIRLRREAAGFVLTIENTCTRFSPFEKAVKKLRTMAGSGHGRGIALARMQERLRSVGGALNLSAGAARMTMTATIPIDEQSSALTVAANPSGTLARHG